MPTNHIISLREAIQLTGNYRDNKDSVLSDRVSKNILPLSETFSRDVFDDLLSQFGCEGVRIYYGMKAEYEICAVVVGVDGDGKDMIAESSLTNIIIEKGERCPDDCPPSSVLNS